MEPLIKTADDVYKVFDAMMNVAERMVMDGKLGLPVKDAAAKRVTDGFSMLQKHSQKQGVTLALDWSKGFIDTGAMVALVLGKVDRIKFAELLLSKHKAYGAAPLMKWGPLGVLIRMDSKWERYLNLCNQQNAESQTGKQFVGGGGPEEPIEDTLKDILGYCVLGFYVSQRIKRNELEADLTKGVTH